jgi:hypothetical protein
LIKFRSIVPINLSMPECGLNPMMNSIQKSRRRFSEFAAAVLLTGVLAACMQPAPPPSCPPYPTAKIAGLVARNRSLETDLAGRSAKIVGLQKKVVDQQFRLLEKEALVKELQRRVLAQRKRLDDAITEVVRAKSKLRSIESKAEAASAIAEAEISVKAMKSRMAAGNPEQVAALEQAQQLLRQSTREFKARNYGGALYLAVQSKTRIGSGDLRLPAIPDVRLTAGEVAFDQPLPLKLTRNTNLRQGPGLRSRVLATLKAGTVISGYAYKDSWIRVNTPAGRTGWVYRSLVMAR